MITIKDVNVLYWLLSCKYHPILVKIVCWLDAKVHKITFTSGFRPGDPKCHGTDPCRALDIRSWDHAEPGAIRDMINKFWQYDPERPGQYKVCKYHKTEDGELHFHIQVHDNTVKRE